MTTFELEIGKLMAQFDSLQKRIDDVQKGMESTNRQLAKWHSDFSDFTGAIMDKIEQKFVLRSEIAPIKAVLSLVAAATLSAICLNLSELIFNKLF